MHSLSLLLIPLAFLGIAEAKPKTQVSLGGKYIDYGCDASIRKTLGEAFDELCPGPQVNCDPSQSYSRKVDWADGNNPVTEKDITVKINGFIPDDESRSRLKDAMLAAVNPKSAKPKDITWDTLGGGKGGCSMSRFTSYIGIATYDGKDYWNGLDVEIEMEKPASFCDATEGIQVIMDSIKHPVAEAGGPIFGAMTYLMCGIEW